jgi:hypothetical protein
MTRYPIVLLLAVLLWSCNGDTTGDVFTLYRSSASGDKMRIHVATFDSTYGENYNRENCTLAQALFQAQHGIKTKFWCEAGRFRK